MVVPPAPARLDGHRRRGHRARPAAGIGTLFGLSGCCHGAPQAISDRGGRPHVRRGGSSSPPPARSRCSPPAPPCSAGTSVAATSSARRRHLPAPARDTTGRRPARSPTFPLSTYVAPSADFPHRHGTGTVPQVDVADWTLTIDTPRRTRVLNRYDELVAMADFDVTVLVLRLRRGRRPRRGHHVAGRAARRCFDKTGVEEAATQVVGHSVDDFTARLPTESASTAHGDGGGDRTAGRRRSTASGPTASSPAGIATKSLDTILATVGGVRRSGCPRGWSKEAGQRRLAHRRHAGGPPSTPGGTDRGVTWRPNGIHRSRSRSTRRRIRRSSATSDSAWVQRYVPHHVRRAQGPVGDEHRRRVTDRRRSGAGSARPARTRARCGYARRLRRRPSIRVLVLASSPRPRPAVAGDPRPVADPRRRGDAAADPGRHG